MAAAQHHPPRAAYIHVPFCARRCGYCNFTLVANRDDLIDTYLEALQCELESLTTPRIVETLFIGGGTPTHLSVDQLSRLLQLISHWFPLTKNYEYSVEANPENIDRQTVQLLSDFGVNRISLGVQSFDESKLKILEREHNHHDICTAVRLAKEFINSVSIDLIFGTPNETLDCWRQDLQNAIDLEPTHLSTYGLTYEKGTSYWTRRKNGLLQSLNEELERQMYALAIDTLRQADYEHYEVSNFAKPGYRCRHNEVYWLGQSYYAAGPGAARYVDGRREINHRSTTSYIKRVLSGNSPVAESEQLSNEDRARELLVFALRRLQGVEDHWFKKQTGFTIDQIAGEAVRGFVELELLSWDEGQLKLTREGLFISDSLWPEILSSI